MKVEEAGGGEIGEMEPPAVSTVAVAVSGGRSSRHALKWALDKFVPEGRVLFRILHVRPAITMVPTPSEKLKGSKTATKISECIPSFCTAYVISKGKLSFVRSATSDIVETPRSISSSTISSPSTRSLSSCAPSVIELNMMSSMLVVLKVSVLMILPITEWGDIYATTNVPLHQPSLPLQRDQALAIINKLSNRRVSSSSSVVSEISYNDEPALTRSHSMISEMQFSSGSSGNSVYKSFQRDNLPNNSDEASVSEISENVNHLSGQDDLRLEIERLRVKLQHLHKLHEGALHESLDTTQKLHKSGARHIEDEIKVKEIQLAEDTVRRLVRKQEMEEREAATEAEFYQRSDEMEAKQSYDGAQEAGENEMGKKIAGRGFGEYNRYTWEEIQASTSSFSSALMIGKGSYGTVYRAKLRHTVAAVKVLNSPEGCGTQQLQQELEVLGKIRHPHLLMMLGACPEHGCLVYEYMENGSLDDMLQRRKQNSSPLAWFDRFRVAWEVAAALMFLHSSKPEPIIHRDLKPANILLDGNLVSKIGDVGLSTLLPVPGTGGGGQDVPSTMVKDTAPVGTFCYIDPEYQRTGVLSMKSDVYALGIVLLQLLTARPPVGLAHAVETALEEGRFADVLDAAAGQWPLGEAQELAVLALRCSEMRRKDRPDLNGRVLPALERLKDVAAKAREGAFQGHAAAPPSHFICPILQEVMVDPYVASDGYTYDGKAIELWLSTNETSPMTNLRLPNKSLIPNHSLRSAIMDWRSRSK
ncbi:U-box domain-containing protein 35 [Zea mays]|uniref:RING-type E3 ubiquitin transferase n=1 Tax=Zea mays TaxID=4577 RepID=A0A1D6NVT3_MAIZE|nr:U-box domain-containing protein 35 [Zea mays]